MSNMEASKLSKKIFGIKTSVRGNQIRSDYIPRAAVKGASGNIEKTFIADIIKANSLIIRDTIEVGDLVGNGVIGRIAAQQSIDVTTAGAKKITSLVSPMIGYPIFMLILVDVGYDGTGKTTDASFDVGTNAPLYDNLISIALPFGFFTLDTQFVSLNFDSAALEMYDGVNDYYINVTTPSDATVETWSISIFGNIPSID